MKNLKNKIIKRNLPGHNGKEFYVMSGKEVEFNNRSIWLLNAIDEKPDYSLWIFEPTEEGEIALWPYEGTNYNDLIYELMELYIETAFDK
jgi:hypothetical protein